MANDTNICIFTGRLGKDSETRFLPNGTAVCNFSMAVGRSWKDQQGNWQEKTAWIDCALFGKAGEHYGPKLVKGAQCLIHAEFGIDEWEKDGQKHKRPKFTVQKVQMLGGRSGDKPEPKEAAATGGDKTGGFDDFDDDIPFAPFMVRASAYLV